MVVDCVAAHDPDTGRAFCEKHDLRKTHENYQSMCPTEVGRGMANGRAQISSRTPWLMSSTSPSASPCAPNGP